MSQNLQEWSAEELQTADKEYVAGTYGRFSADVISGNGAELKSRTGKIYIDMTSGIGVNAFGAADPIWSRAVAEQAAKLQHISNLYYTEPCVRLAQMLCQKTGMKKVFFGNSGAEANECIIKVARKYAADKKNGNSPAIITMSNSFHGRTLTTLAATGQDHYHEQFQPLTPGFYHTPINDIPALEQAVAERKACAILLECIQGEGGVIPLNADFIQAAERIAHEQDALLLIDEVQTGNGRTGKLYAYMNFGVHPDAVSTAKGLAGGLPMGAALLSEKVQHVLGPGDHGSTFGGNPVCSAGALTILSRLTDDFLAEVQQKGQWLREQLANAPGVDSVTGLGLMIGIKPKEKKAGDILKNCLEKGLFVLTAKDKIRLLPPLNITMPQLEKAVAILKEAFA